MSPTAANARVLYVEDEVLVQDMVLNALAEAGFAAEAVDTGEDALVVLETRAREFAALISDINLAGEADGWAVARRARELNGSLPVVYVSGASAHDWASQGVPDSVMITKPFAPAQIVVAIAGLINRASSRPAG